jgi:hemerythrin-like domain-containing protein
LRGQAAPATHIFRERFYEFPAIFSRLFEIYLDMHVQLSYIAAAGVFEEENTMTTATATLRTEHEAILGMLEATEEAASQIASGITVNAEILNGLLDFFKIFADRCHHGKEEELLFPLLERRGMPRNGGPLGVMLAEHDQGRALIRNMSESAAQFEAGNREAADTWAHAARAYAALLRAHIQKENNILFMLAERMLSNEDQVSLAAAFEILEVEKMGSGTHERLHGLMEHLRQEIFSRTAPAR